MIKENIIYFIDSEKNIEMAQRGCKVIIPPNVDDIVFFEDYEKSKFKVTERRIKYLNNGYAIFEIECKRL